MVFSNLFFLYFFLPLNLICYFLAKSIHVKNGILIVFSLFFYAWGEPRYVPLLVGMVAINWLFGLMIEKFRGQKLAKAGLVGACVCSLTLLGVFKYLTLILGTTHDLFGLPSVVPQILLPIGISFYTFQLLSYVVDVYRGEVEAQDHFFRLLLYTSLFHQCIAGPLVRYKDISEEILYRRVNRGEVARGINRFAAGLAKKAVLANTCGLLADQFLLADATVADVSLFAKNAAALSAKPAVILWMGVLFFMLQIYLDFSAYSDMAIGMGLMIGFHYKENFNYPYLSSTVSEFWRRWHISLGSFFRDYVYIPLGGSRRGLGRTILNLFVVWALTGLWHGASWNFVLWGLYFFVFIALERLFLNKVFAKLPGFVSHIYLLVVVYFGWILFRFKNMALIGVVLKGMFCQNGNPWTTFEANTTLLNYIFFLLIAVIAVTPVVHNIGRAVSTASGRSAVWFRVNSVLQVALPLGLLLISTMSLVGNSYNPFLYFQF